jgi:hypothetical protein
MKLKFCYTMQIICAYYRGDRSLKWYDLYDICPSREKTEFSYFPGYVFHTSLLYVLVLPDVLPKLFCKTTVTLLYGVISVPSSQYCTSLRYHIILLSVIMLYFCPSQYCTFLGYHICIFYHDLVFMQNYKGSYTSLKWVFVLFVLTVVYFRSLQCCPFGFTITILYFPPLSSCTSSVIMLYLFLSQYCTSLCYYIVFSIMTYFLCKITRRRILP